MGMVSLSVAGCAPRGETLIKANHLMPYLGRFTTASSSIFLQFTFMSLVGVLYTHGLDTNADAFRMILSRGHVRTRQITSP